MRFASGKFGWPHEGRQLFIQAPWDLQRLKFKGRWEVEEGRGKGDMIDEHEYKNIRQKNWKAYCMTSTYEKKMCEEKK